MMTADIHTLTGAYAVDALSGEERAMFEQHLTDCAACAQEVRELQATAAQLGQAAAAQPPADLKRRVLAEIGTTRQLPPEVPVEREPTAGVSRPRVNRWPLRAALAAAAAAAAAGVFGVQDYQKASQLQQEQAQAAGMAAVLSAPDAHTVRAPGVTGGIGTVVVSRSQDKAVFLASGMPRVAPDHTYQLWFIGSNGAVSAGLLQPDGGDRIRPVITGGPGDAAKIGVTVEPAGGSRQPTTQPVLLLNLA